MQAKQHFMPKCKVIIFLIGLGFLYACNNQQKKENQQPVTETAAVMDKDVQSGRELFHNNCSGCHQTNNEFVVGSGLCNVTKRRTKEWLFRYTRNSYQLIEEGDSVALALFKKNKTPMLAYPTFTDAELTNLYKYIDYIDCKDEFSGQWPGNRQQKK